MIQEEIDLIYDYLHENYRYEDGNFTRKHDSRAHKKGSALTGQLNYSDKQCMVLCVSLPITNSKNIPYSKLIFLYHNKIYPKYMEFIDKNPMNCRIENLKQSYKQIKSVKPRKFNIVKTKNTIKYRTCILLNNQYISLGQHETQEKASLIYDKALQLFNDGVHCGATIKKIIKNEFPEAKLIMGNKSGYQCVFCEGKKFRYEFSINKKTIKQTGFLSAEEAHQAYLKAKQEHQNQ